jgi:hypothetical protein
MPAFIAPHVAKFKVISERVETIVKQAEVMVEASIG